MKSAARFAVACLGLYVLQGWAAEPTILVDQVGYERQAGKQAIVSADAGQALQDFQVIDTRNGRALRHPEKQARPDTPLLRKPDWLRVRAPGNRPTSVRI